MKKSFVLIVFIIFFSISFSQESKVIETQFKVFGNCNQCKTRIEKAVKIDEVKYAKWNKSTKMLRLAFENTITSDSLQKRIASVGHDTQKSTKQLIQLTLNCRIAVFTVMEIIRIDEYNFLGERK